MAGASCWCEMVQRCVVFQFGEVEAGNNGGIRVRVECEVADCPLARRAKDKPIVVNLSGPNAGCVGIVGCSAKS